MQVIVATKAGFCSGVRRAINQLLNHVALHGAGSTLGSLVHNEAVLEYLEKHQVTCVASPEEAAGSFLAISTHGVTPEILRSIQKLSQIECIDLTCPRVLRLQKLVSELSKKGFHLIIFGDRSHPEVKGLIGWTEGKVDVVSSPDDLEKITLEQPAALIAQTTGDPALYEQTKRRFKQKAPGGEVHHTLCLETRLRQEEVIKMSKRVDALVVVGSKTSANTKALLECCRQLKPSCRATSARELDRSFLRKYKVFGVTAGASTPPWTIKEVVERMEAEILDSNNEEEFDFAGEIKAAQIGEQVVGKVARVAEGEVFLDIGSKTEAILPSEEVYLAEGKGLADLFSPEDEVEVTVLDVNEEDGKIVVSHRRLAREKRLNELEDTMESGLIVEGRVKQIVPAGIVLDLGSGIEGFMPGSQVDTKYIANFQQFKGQQLLCKILEYDREKRKLILSRKKVLEEEGTAKKGDILGTLQVGSTVTGFVKRLTDFGAFIDLGGIDGLVHVSELSWDRVAHPREVLQIGEEIEVKVLEIDPEKERISLSIRKTKPDPRVAVFNEFKVGQVVKGRVTRLVDFGAFIELKPGIEGLAHISQLAEYHVKHPAEILKVGEVVEVKILEVKSKLNRISLSLKDALGVGYTAADASSKDTDNGNVTIGDLFGDLFNREVIPAVDHASANDDLPAVEEGSAPLTTGEKKEEEGARG